MTCNDLCTIFDIAQISTIVHTQMLTTISAMKNTIVLLAFILTFSCSAPTNNSEQKEPLIELEGEEELTLREESGKLSVPTPRLTKDEQSTTQETEEPEITPEFEKESLNSLIGTTWIYQPYPEHPNCVDTIRINDMNAFDYHCEIEIKYDIEFKIQDDTLFTELYGYKSEVDAGLGKEVKSKCKFIKSNGELIAVYRAWRYADSFKPVKPNNLYQRYSKL